MNKPQLSLALSLSLVLLQANWLAAHSEPQGAIWQRMSTPSSAVKVSKAPVIVKQHKSNIAIDQSHAMLFLPGKSQDGGSALAIHPSLPASKDTGKLAAVPSSALSGASAPQAAAQFAPDQVIAQAAPDQTSYVQSQPIPPVVNGTVELEEFKTTNAIDLKVSQSRTFKFKNKIVRTSISDPGIAEPVVVSENQMVLLGKTPGTCTMLLWDDAGNSISVDLRVSKDYSQLQATLREIDPRIIVKAFSVGGSDRVLLTGDVDHPESIIRAFAASNVFMDDRGMNIQVANSRIVAGRIGEQAAGGGGGGGGAQGQLSTIGNVDRYTFFGNLPNNISKSQVMLSDGGRVTSLVKVRKVPLIALHVTFMEMNTSASRELGTQLGIGVSGRGFAFGIGGNNNTGGQPLTSYGGARFLQQLLIAQGSAQGVPVSIGPSFIAQNNPRFPGAISQPQFGTQSNMQPVSFVGSGGVLGTGQATLLAAPALLQQAVLLGAPGGAGINLNSLINMFTGFSNFGNNQRVSINPTIQGSIGNSRARVLAEPTLVTISGERASFLAGGELPIVQAVAAAGQAQQSVVFEPFGMRINMIPVLQENGTINLEVSPEERILSPALGFTTGPGAASTVPGFTTRKSQTIVELKPGQELYLAGLVTTNTGRELTKLPIWGEVPVLGALYRSKAFAKNESELVVCVRPEIILPGTPGQLKLPEEIGRVEGPRDTNLLQVEPTVVDERHYTSGRSERHQKTSPTLPEGAPIPDNE